MTRTPYGKRAGRLLRAATEIHAIIRRLDGHASADTIHALRVAKVRLRAELAALDAARTARRAEA